MLEEIWFMLAFWIICICIGFKFRQKFFFGLSAIAGLFLGFLAMVNVYLWLGMIFIFLSLYLLYYTMFVMVKEK